MLLPRTFYARKTEQVAKELLGTYLVHNSLEGKTVGRIVETEAYLSDDPAAHSFKGKTERNKSMFLPAGKAYVYTIYGIYQCFNVVTNAEHVGEAVLIRALEPIEGVELMKKRIGTDDVQKLCNGPGKLVKAMGISRKLDGSDLCEGPLQILSADSYPSKGTFDVHTTTRVGITKAAEMPLRFYIKGSPYLSRK